MQPNQRLSIMTFPQFFDGNELHLNIVVLPRDHNPLNPILIGGEPPNQEIHQYLIRRLHLPMQSFPLAHKCCKVLAPTLYRNLNP